MANICDACGEDFPGPVWECSGCGHHNHAEDGECGNCHDHLRPEVVHS